MAREKTCFACTACGYETARWVGRCPGCGAWNTMEESVVAAPAKAAAAAKPLRQRPGSGAQAMLLRDIPEDAAARLSTGIGELDRVLGGGIVEGSLAATRASASPRCCCRCARICAPRGNGCSISAARNPPSR